MLSSLLVLFQSVVVTKLILHRNWNEQFELFRSQILNSKSIVTKCDINEKLDKNFDDLSHQERLDILTDYQRSKGSLYPMPLVTYISYSIIFLLKDHLVAYFFGYFTLSIFAFITDSYFIYGLFLFEVVYKTDTLRTVVASVTHNGDQLLWTLVLFLIFLWIYTVIGYVVLNSQFWNDTYGEAGENGCSTAWQCFMTLIS